MKRALFLILLLLLTLLPYERGSAPLTVGAGGTLYIPMDDASYGVNITVTQSFSVTNFKVYTCADSYVDSYNPGTNYGSSNIMYFGQYTPYIYQAYMAFIYPATSISGAIFRGTAIRSQGTSDGYVDIGTFFVTGVWNESTITWNNRPSDTGSSLYTFRIYYSTSSFPVTITFPSSSYSDILSMLNNTYHGIVLRQVAAGNVYGILATKEHSTASYRPYLQINGTINPLKWIYITKYNTTHLQVRFNGYFLNAKAIDSIWFRVTSPSGSSYVNASLSGTSFVAYLAIPRSYFTIDRVTFKYADNPSIAYTFSIVIFDPSAVRFNFKPGMISYNDTVKLNFTIPSLSGNIFTVVADMPNGTKRSIPVSSNTSLKLAEGRNWLYLIYSGYNFNSTLDVSNIIIDHYLPDPPVLNLIDNSNYTYDLLNVSWSHSGFDVEYFIIQVWKTGWSTSLINPAKARWNFVQLLGSGTYYIRVIARDAAGNEKSSEIKKVNIASSDVIITNMIFNRTGMSLSFKNTVNASRDCFWNVSLTTIEGSMVEYRQGSLSFYPLENKTFSITWSKNLSENIYLATVWVKDSFGKASGYQKSFIAIPPIQTATSVPLSISYSSWESLPTQLNSSVTLQSIIVIVNANHVESQPQVVTAPLPNVTLASVSTKNRITGADYYNKFGAGLLNVTIPSIAPYSTLIIDVKAVSSGKISATLKKVEGAQGLIMIGTDVFRIYNATITNPLPIEVSVIIPDNSTLKFDCPQCVMSGGQRLLNIVAKSTQYLKAYKLEPQNGTYNWTAKPMSSLLGFMSSTTLGVLIDFLVVAAVVAAIARWEMGA
jgi:hypothetical protein